MTVYGFPGLYGLTDGIFDADDFRGGVIQDHGVGVSGKIPGHIPALQDGPANSGTIIRRDVDVMEHE